MIIRVLDATFPNCKMIENKKQQFYSDFSEYKLKGVIYMNEKKQMDPQKMFM
jgi:hypothetical protein